MCVCVCVHVGGGKAWGLEECMDWGGCRVGVGHMLK